MTPPPKQWQQARLSRDSRFDGAFYIGVLTTGIFCRPICPATIPKEENVRYLLTPSQAIDQGFRPCRRCRPEYSPTSQQAWPDERLSAAIEHINAGFLDQHDVGALAARVELSERQLRRLFTDTLGVSPSQMAETRRLLLAKQLLCDSTLSITQVALAAGFNSIRRFNDKVKNVYQQTPTQIRRTKRHLPVDSGDRIIVDIPHVADYPWSQVFEFYQQRAIEGMELTGTHSFARALVFDHTPILIHCEKIIKRGAIRLTITGAKAHQVTDIIAHTRRVLDLNTNHLVISEHLRSDPLLKSIIKPTDRIALPGAWDAFEYLVRAIIGQQVSVKAAKTLTQRVIDRLGSSIIFDKNYYLLFPTASALAQGNLDGLGMTTRRVDTIKAIAQAQLSGRIDLTAPTTLVTLQRELLATKGIGPWTVDYLMMRGFQQPDMWLDTDLGVINALKNLGQPTDKKGLRQRGETWSPWRSYAVLALWRSL